MKKWTRFDFEVAAWGGGLLFAMFVLPTLAGKWSVQYLKDQPSQTAPAQPTGTDLAHKTAEKENKPAVLSDVVTQTGTDLAYKMPQKEEKPYILLDMVPHLPQKIQTYKAFPVDFDAQQNTLTRDK